MAETQDKLSAAQRGKIRRLSQPRELAPDEEGGELNIVPFLDIVTNVLMFVLATVAVTFTAMIDTQPPRFSGASARGPNNATLSLNLVVLHDGILVSAAGQRIGAGCQGQGSGLAVGMRSGGGKEYDFPALTDCVKRLKGIDPAFADERTATITADPDIPYQVIISTMDAIRRTDDGQELFPEVNFGVPK